MPFAKIKTGAKTLDSIYDGLSVAARKGDVTFFKAVRMSTRLLSREKRLALRFAVLRDIFGKKGISITRRGVAKVYTYFDDAFIATLGKLDDLTYNRLEAAMRSWDHRQVFRNVDSLLVSFSVDTQYLTARISGLSTKRMFSIAESVGLDLTHYIKAPVILSMLNKFSRDSSKFLAYLIKKDFYHALRVAACKRAGDFLRTPSGRVITCAFASVLSVMVYKKGMTIAELCAEASEVVKKQDQFLAKYKAIWNKESIPMLSFKTQVDKGLVINLVKPSGHNAKYVKCFNKVGVAALLYCNDVSPYNEALQAWLEYCEVFNISAEDDDRLSIICGHFCNLLLLKQNDIKLLKASYRNLVVSCVYCVDCFGNDVIVCRKESSFGNWFYFVCNLYNGRVTCTNNNEDFVMFSDGKQIGYHYPFNEHAVQFKITAEFNPSVATLAAASVGIIKPHIVHDAAGVEIDLNESARKKWHEECKSHIGEIYEDTLEYYAVPCQEVFIKKNKDDNITGIIEGCATCDSILSGAERQRLANAKLYATVLEFGPLPIGLIAMVYESGIDRELEKEENVAKTIHDDIEALFN